MDFLRIVGGELMNCAHVAIQHKRLKSNRRSRSPNYEVLAGVSYFKVYVRTSEQGISF